MTKVLGYRINEELKDEYDGFIKEKYGHKQNRCGKAIEKLMKLELALNGRPDYKDDPDVKMFLESLKKNNVIHTHSGSSGSRGSGGVDLFARSFMDEYKDRKQITRTELGYFASFLEGIVDPRSVQNRINYLIAAGLLNPVAPGVFEIQKGEIGSCGTF